MMSARTLDCKACKRPYSTTHDDDPGTCPICRQKIMSRRAMLKKVTVASIGGMSIGFSCSWLIQMIWNKLRVRAPFKDMGTDARAPAQPPATLANYELHF